MSGDTEKRQRNERFYIESAIWENQTMARKIISHKKHVQGLEAPRNSQELRIQNSSAKVDLPAARDRCYPFESSMKKLINEEISSTCSNPKRQNSPSIVARLMGMDMNAIGSDTKKMENPRSSYGSNNNGIVEELDFDRHIKSTVKLRSREHPQEEELQRFKKEFEAWQAQRLRECSQFLAQEDLSLNRLKSKAKTVDFPSPTRIVILKPGPDRLSSSTNRDSWSSSSPCSSEQRGNIEDFLEEVRERLRTEMHGKMVKRVGSSVARGSGIETPFSERALSDPKQFSQTKAPSSPEFISRDTRRFVSERLKNVVKKEPGFGGHSRSYSVTEERRFETVRDERETRARSFRIRHGVRDNRVVRGEPSSPRSLVRSLSAPVSSGTSFGKLLLEDRHILTGAQIRRKLEDSVAPSEVKKRKKEKSSFSFREKVFSLGGKIFGKKIPSVMESCISEHFPIKDIASGPTVMANFGERHERDNFTEVPPSPASVCSSGQEEFWRPFDNLSPMSTPDITPCDDYALPRVFREISSNLSELRRQLDQLESQDEEIIQPKPKPKPIKTEALELKDPAEAYVRDLLVASGLYDRSTSDRFLWKWETLSKPISASVFEEVEERHRKLSKDHNSSSTSTDHRLLHDLLNEALSAVLRQPSSRSFATALHGKELLHCVWEIVGRHLRSHSDRTVGIGDIGVDDLVARDLRLSSWGEAMDDIVSSLGREMESVIMEELVEEILVDIKAIK